MNLVPGEHLEFLYQPQHIMFDCAARRVFKSSRKRGTPWTEEEHRLFLVGLKECGKGDWKGISRKYVTTRTPTQVASHAQKYFIRLSDNGKRRVRPSLFDIQNPGDLEAMNMKQANAEGDDSDSGEEAKADPEGKGPQATRSQRSDGATEPGSRGDAVSDGPPKKRAKPAAAKPPSNSAQTASHTVKARLGATSAPQEGFTGLKIMVEDAPRGAAAAAAHGLAQPMLRPAPPGMVQVQNGFLPGSGQAPPPPGGHGQQIMFLQPGHLTSSMMGNGHQGLAWANQPQMLGRPMLMGPPQAQPQLVPLQGNPFGPHHQGGNPGGYMMGGSGLQAQLQHMQQMNLVAAVQHAQNQVHQAQNQAFSLAQIQAQVNAQAQALAHAQGLAMMPQQHQFQLHHMGQAGPAQAQAQPPLGFASLGGDDSGRGRGAPLTPAMPQQVPPPGGMPQGGMPGSLPGSLPGPGTPFVVYG